MFLKKKDFFFNIVGYQRLQSIINSLSSPIHFTGSALHPYSLATILNDIGINQRKSILEFGSGIGTFIIAKYIDLYGFDGKLYSVEEDENWLNYVQSWLKSEGLENRVDLVYAPNNKGSNLEWYDEKIILESLPEKLKVDMMIIDGPQAWQKDKRKIRQNIPKSIFGLLNDRCSIFLDDCHRKGEQNAIGKWSKEYGLSFNRLPSNTAVAFKGEKFNISLI